MDVIISYRDKGGNKMRTIRRNSKEFKNIWDKVEKVDVVTMIWNESSIEAVKKDVEMFPKMFKVWQAKENQITVYFHSNLSYTLYI